MFPAGHRAELAACPPAVIVASMYLIIAACLAMTSAITRLRRHMPHATPVCHIKGDMNCVTSPRTGQSVEQHGWDIHALRFGAVGARVTGVSSWSALATDGSALRGDLRAAADAGSGGPVRHLDHAQLHLTKPRPLTCNYGIVRDLHEALPSQLSSGGASSAEVAHAI